MSSVLWHELHLCRHTCGAPMALFQDRAFRAVFDGHQMNGGLYARVGHINLSPLFPPLLGVQVRAFYSSDLCA